MLVTSSSSLLCILTPVEPVVFLPVLQMIKSQILKSSDESKRLFKHNENWQFVFTDEFLIINIRWCNFRIC